MGHWLVWTIAVRKQSHNLNPSTMDSYEITWPPWSHESNLLRKVNFYLYIFRILTCFSRTPTTVTSPHWQILIAFNKYLTIFCSLFQTFSASSNNWFLFVSLPSLSSSSLHLPAQSASFPHVQELMPLTWYQQVSDDTMELRYNQMATGPGALAASLMFYSTFRSLGPRVDH